MARPEKVKVVEEFTEFMDSSQAVYVADYQGLDVGQISELRAAFRAEGVKMRVAKNTLVRRAMEASGAAELASVLSGPNAFVFGFDDPVVPARIIREFKKKAKVEKPAVRGFIMDGQFLPGEEFDAISELPGKDELVARVVGSIQAPLSELVYTFSGILRELVGTVEALADKRKAEAG
jgi:large subunit ribosomal protein L10